MSEVVYHVFVPDAESTEPLESLKSHLELRGGESIDIDKDLDQALRTRLARLN
ncbi:MAG: hypothetical protein O3C40_28105 [Planctomycetota bacterium]|nr:hypothetical protein [Planctomycetota bacterium]